MAARWRVKLETKVAEDYAKFYNHGEGPYSWLKTLLVSIVSYSWLIIVSASQFHIYLPWGQRPFSIVPKKCLKCECARNPTRGLLRDCKIFVSSSSGEVVTRPSSNYPPVFTHNYHGLAPGSSGATDTPTDLSRDIISEQRHLQPHRKQRGLVP